MTDAITPSPDTLAQDTLALASGIDARGWADHAILSVAESGRADREAMAAGIEGTALMEAAGRAVADAVCDRVPPGRVAVLCGPGNNGGDGFVAARHLKRRGWSVRLGLLGAPSDLTGDAAWAAEAWDGDTEPLTPDILDGTETVVDAIFGAGLNRPPEGQAAATLQAVGHRPRICVDVPSGVHGDSGAVLCGAAPGAALATVTFFRRKPGHFLMPGRDACGAVVLADIGIPESVLERLQPRAAMNHPALWARALPEPQTDGHKFSRGHVLAVGGASMIGAGCLTVRAAQRAGAGMVTCAVPVQQAPLYRLALESAVVRSAKDTRAFRDILEARPVGCSVIGPGLGVMAPGAHEKVLAMLRAPAPAVLDADALSLFAEAPQTLFDQIAGPVLLTPHEGEFARLFPDLTADGTDDKLGRARKAAARSGAVVLLKGRDTVIAAPDGLAVINANAPPDLATAGAGDVLAGTAAGLIAAGMPVFAAACAAAHATGAAAQTIGPGLIASDLPAHLPKILDGFRAIASN